MRISQLLCGALAICLLLSAESAWADGCFMRKMEISQLGKSGTLVTSPKQEAILATDGETVQVVLRTHFNAGPKELCWFVPVPDVPDDIRKSDDTVFDLLQEVTAPKFYSYKIVSRGHGFKLGCSAGDSSEQVALASAPAVRVEKVGVAGIFDFQVLSADRADDLLKWLNDHEYSAPEGAAKVFEPYIQKKWHWLAIRVRAEEADKPTLAPHPISYTYKSKELIFPLIISALSAADETEIVLYVVGSNYYRPKDWKAATLMNFQRSDESRRQPLRKQSGTPSGTNYEELFRRMANQAGGRLLVTEFAQPWQMFGSSEKLGRRFDNVLESRFVAAFGERQKLTRLRACVRREQMTQDIALAVIRPEPRPVDNEVPLYGTVEADRSDRPIQAGGTVAGLAALAACAAGGLARPRRKGARAARTIIVGVGLALLAVI